MNDEKIIAIRVVEKATNEVVETIDVAGETEGGIRQVVAGLRAQLNHEEYRLDYMSDRELA